MKKHSLDILIIINIILALFLFFGDKFITTVDWEIFGSIATVISAIAMIVTAVIMYQGNEISAKSSADSIHEMREQYKQQKKDNQYREDKKELKEYIEKYIMSEVKKLKISIENIDSEMPEKDMGKFNIFCFSSLVDLMHDSLGSFYQDKSIKILTGIYTFSPIIESSKDYSYNVKWLFFCLLNYISTTLYKALIDEQSFESLIKEINQRIKEIVENLTDEEKEKIKLYNSQNNN